MLMQLARSLGKYYETPRKDASTGKTLPCSFPPVVVSTGKKQWAVSTAALGSLSALTTGGYCCWGSEGGGAKSGGHCIFEHLYAGPAPTFDDVAVVPPSPFDAVGFKLPAMYSSHFFYDVHPVMLPQAFTLTAYSDLDCDGLAATFRVTGSGHSDADGKCVFNAPKKLFRYLEGE